MMMSRLLVSSRWHASSLSPLPPPFISCFSSCLCLVLSMCLPSSWPRITSRSRFAPPSAASLQFAVHQVAKVHFISKNVSTGTSQGTVIASYIIFVFFEIFLHTVIPQSFQRGYIFQWLIQYHECKGRCCFLLSLVLIMARSLGPMPPQDTGRVPLHRVTSSWRRRARRHMH